MVDGRERGGDQLVEPQGCAAGRRPCILLGILLGSYYRDRDCDRGAVIRLRRRHLTSHLLLEGHARGHRNRSDLAGASRPAEGILATVLGVGALLFAAIGVVVQLKDALNVVWEVEESEQSGIWHFARNYLLSFAAVLALGFLLLVSLLVTACLAAAGKFVAPYLPEGLLHVVSTLVSFAVVTIMFAMMFKWLPDVLVAWRDVRLGALLTALFFEVGKAAIGLYIGKQGLESTYGAAASIVVVLIWVYYTPQIILMGAEITHAYAKHRGSFKPQERSNRTNVRPLSQPRQRGEQARRSKSAP